MIADLWRALRCWYYRRRYHFAFAWGGPDAARIWMERLERAAGWYDLPGP